jgi:hypothetical protein
MSPVVGFTVAGRAPPPPNHIQAPQPGDVRLSRDVQQALIRGEEDALALITIPLLVVAGLLVVARQFFTAAAFATLVVLIFLATFYARRPHIAHRLARILRAVFYVSFTYPGDKHPPRLSLRLSVIVVAVLLLGLLRFGVRGLAFHHAPEKASAAEASAKP